MLSAATVALLAITLKDLFLLDRLENFDDAFLVIDDVYTLKHFTVFASANLPDDLIVILVPAAGTVFEKL